MQQQEYTFSRTERVTYESGGNTVTLSMEDIKNYLVSGDQKDKITDAELRLALELCRAQKLNPWTREVYVVKFKEDMQLIIGLNAFVRRSDENPNYQYRESGIVVQRGKEVFEKQGACLYPTEVLIGGWCRVFYTRNGKDVKAYKEVSLNEYRKNGTTERNPWNRMPATMIEKVAVCQALRAAFPKDYEGLYTPEEFGVSTERIKDVKNIPESTNDKQRIIGETDPEQTLIGFDERKRLFDMAGVIYGESAKDALQQVLHEYGIESTRDVPYSIYETLIEKFNIEIESLMQEFAQDSETEEGDCNV